MIGIRHINNNAIYHWNVYVKYHYLDVTSPKTSLVVTGKWQK